MAEFTIPPKALPFGDTLADSSDIRIEIERVVPTDESALPFFWVWGIDPEQFMAAAEREPDITDIQLLDRMEGGALFRAEWAPDAAVINGLKQLRATIVESEGTAERWRFEVRAPDHDAFAEFQQVFEAANIPISLVRVNDLAEVVEGDQRALTPVQRETLIAAYRAGYFEQPRQVTQEELGERFDVSYRAVSERLRRGIRNLVSTTLLPAGEAS